MGHGIPPASDSTRPRLTLMTGFPGFLSQHLLKGLLEGGTCGEWVFLIQSGQRALAQSRLEALALRHPHLRGHWALVEGDLAHPLLGLAPQTYADLTARVRKVWHLAAVYDLAVPEELAYRVNVWGTSHVLDFCEACTSLERLHHVSTCYVSGQRTGRILESDLDQGQGHKNHYEATKFWAEVEVQRRWRHIPTVVYRPGIVVGDSRTGETGKYDGPYYLFRALARLPDWVPMINVGRGDARVNLVSVDYTVAAMAHIGQLPDAEGQVFQIVDPQALSARAIVAQALRHLGRRPAKATLPAAWASAALDLASVERWLGIPREALAYFNHDAVYDSSHTDRALRTSNIRCPALSTYLGRLLDFMVAHPEFATSSSASGVGGRRATHESGLAGS